MVKLRVDQEADALYLRLDDSAIVESEEVSPGVVLDYNASNDVVGVEMFGLSQRSSELNLSALQFETVCQAFSVPRGKNALMTLAPLLAEHAIVARAGSYELYSLGEIVGASD